MNPRLALLSAILANPDDDLPRLVFADWLEENGTSDADAARVEFIRLGCKSRAKSRITTAEGRWLDANWRRLLVNTLTLTHPVELTAAGESVFFRRTGRYVQLHNIQYALLEFEYVRGFARRVEYRSVQYYRRGWRLAATDEPIAYHRPKFDRQALTSSPVGTLYMPRHAWGDEVYDRTVGNDSETTYSALMPGIDPAYGQQRLKVFAATPTPEAAATIYHPLALHDVGQADNPRQREWAGVATAMTALAREFVGLAEPTPGG
jgi:uncharacterized protein (TIGR02996 family)